MYAQTDPRWASKLLGYNTDKTFNIGSYGCLVTAIANLLTANGDDSTPDTVNNALKQQNGFAAVKQPDGSYSTKDSGILSWPTVTKLNPAIVDCGVVHTLGEVNNWLLDGPNYAIIEVRAGRNQHFVLGTQVNTIVDSQDGHQKNILAYPFVQARLYRWLTPGKGAAIVTNGELPMTGPEETEAYQILFNRVPDIPVPTGRTGLQLIRDAKDELERIRANAATQVAAAMGRATDAESKLAEMSNLAAPTSNVVVAPMPDGVTDEVVNQAVRVTNSVGEMIDYGGSGAPFIVKEGTIFHQYSTFIAAGRVQVRTQKSKDNGMWYGTDDSLFDPLPTNLPVQTKTDAAHLGASKIAGTLGAIWRKFWHKGK